LNTAVSPGNLPTISTLMTTQTPTESVNLNEALSRGSY
jgi:hypothetical protein